MIRINGISSVYNLPCLYHISDRSLYQLLSIRMEQTAKRHENLSGEKFQDAHCRHLITLQTNTHTHLFARAKVFVNTVKLILVVFSCIFISPHTISWMLTNEQNFRCGSTRQSVSVRVHTHTQNINYLRRMPFIINYILLWHLGKRYSSHLKASNV